MNGEVLPQPDPLRPGHPGGLSLRRGSLFADNSCNWFLKFVNAVLIRVPSFPEHKIHRPQQQYKTYHVFPVKGFF